MTNPMNCANCQHKPNNDGGHCYMFKNEPSGVCHQFKPFHAVWIQNLAEANPEIKMISDMLYAIKGIK